MASRVQNRSRPNNFRRSKPAKKLLEWAHPDPRAFQAISEWYGSKEGVIVPRSFLSEIPRCRRSTCGNGTTPDYTSRTMFYAALLPSLHDDSYSNTKQSIRYCDASGAISYATSAGDAMAVAPSGDEASTWASAKCFVGHWGVRAASDATGEG